MQLTSRHSIPVFISICVMILSGCVSSGTYRAKEDESIQLSRNLDEAQKANIDLMQKNRALADENEALARKLKDLDAGMAAFRQEQEALKLENERLKSAVKPENIIKTLIESIASLQAENAKLKQEIASAEKVSPVKAPVPPVKLSPVLTRPIAAIDGSGKKPEESLEVEKKDPDKSDKIPKKVKEPEKD